MFPKGTAVVSVEPDELLLSCVEGNQVSLGTLRVNERQANGDDFVRFAGCARQVAKSNKFVDRLRDARAVP